MTTLFPSRARTNWLPSLISRSRAEQPASVQRFTRLPKAIVALEDLERTARLLAAFV